MPVCPQGHDSADDDFCDVCGLAFSSPGVPALPIAPPVAEPEPATRPCPACGAPLSGRFCEDCGADSLSAAPPQAPESVPVALAETPGPVPAALAETPGPVPA